MKGLFLALVLTFSAITTHLYQQKPLEDSLSDGEEVYTDFCVQCHISNGEGVPNAFPPLAKSDFLNNIDKSIHALKYGLSGPIIVNGKPYNAVMATQGLDNEEIADVMNYILRNWGNTTDTVVTEDYVNTIAQ